MLGKWKQGRPLPRSIVNTASMRLQSNDGGIRIGAWAKAN